MTAAVRLKFFSAKRNENTKSGSDRVKKLAPTAKDTVCTEKAS